MNLKLIAALLLLFNSTTIQCSAMAKSSQKTTLKSISENKAAPPEPAVKEQLPSAAVLRKLLANQLNPKHDFSHFYDVMEIETALAGKQMTRDEIEATIYRKSEVYITHTHLLGQSIISWNNTHVPKIIELILNELPKKPVPAPLPIKKGAKPQQKPLPARNARPFTAAAAAHAEDDDDLDDDAFGYDISER